MTAFHHHSPNVLTNDRAENLIGRAGADILFHRWKLCAQSQAEGYQIDNYIVRVNGTVMLPPMLAIAGFVARPDLGVAAWQNAHFVENPSLNS